MKIGQIIMLQCRVLPNGKLFRCWWSWKMTIFLIWYLLFSPNKNQLGFHMRCCLFLHHGRFVQNLGKQIGKMYFGILSVSGQVRFGQVWLSQVRFGQVKLGQVWLVQVRLGLVRFGWVGLGLVRLSQVRFGRYIHRF